NEFSAPSDLPFHGGDKRETLFWEHYIFCDPSTSPLASSVQTSSQGLLLLSGLFLLLDSVSYSGLSQRSLSDRLLPWQEFRVHLLKASRTGPVVPAKISIEESAR